MGNPAPIREQISKGEEAQVLTKAVLRAARQLDITDAKLARMLGVSQASVSRLQSQRQIDPTSKEGEFALLFLRLFRSLDAIVGGHTPKAKLWLHADNTPLGGRPIDRVETIEGLVAIVQYLDAIRGRA